MITSKRKLCGFLSLLLVVLETRSALSESRLQCEMLPAEMCAFAVESSGRRCVLGDDAVHCLASGVVVGEDSPTEYIENEQCVEACGAGKAMVGLPWASELAEERVLAKLCSRECHRNCPNLVDFFSTPATILGWRGPLDPYTALCRDWTRKRAGFLPSLQFRWFPRF